MTTFIKAYTAVDFQKIADIATIIWKEYYTPIIGVKQVDYMLEKFQSLRAIKKQVREGVQYYSIKHQGAVVGYLSFYKKENSLFLSKLYVLSIERGKGIGKKAMLFLNTKRKENGCKNISLTVNKYNTKSIKAYEKMGFAIIDALVLNIGDGYVMDDYIMKKEFD